MKMAEALRIIKEGKKRNECPPGFMVHFERVEGSLLTGGYFPDKHAGEPLIPTEEEAWQLAKEFAENTPSSYTNIYVIQGNFVPVPGYKEKVFKRYS